MATYWYCNFLCNCYYSVSGFQPLIQYPYQLSNSSTKRRPRSYKVCHAPPQIKRMSLKIKRPNIFQIEILDPRGRKMCTETDRATKRQTLIRLFVVFPSVTQHQHQHLTRSSEAVILHILNMVCYKR